MPAPTVAVLDYGSGNVRSAVRMLQHIGADVSLTVSQDECMAADALVVPGVGNFHATMRALWNIKAPRFIENRLAGGRAVLGICVGMQVMFEGSTEPAAHREEGMGEWPGTVEQLSAPVVPHMGWNTVVPAEGSCLFEGVESERFYFVHSYAAQEWTLQPTGVFEAVAPKVSWSNHGGPFVAAVENGPLTATQFHPEKSGKAGERLLRNWLQTIPRR